MFSAAPGAPMSGVYARYAASAPRSASAHVEESYQSKRTSLLREAARTSNPAAFADSAT